MDTGSRYETPDVYGINHFFEHMIFKVCLCVFGSLCRAAAAHEVAVVCRECGMRNAQSTTRRSDFDLVRQMSKIAANGWCRLSITCRTACADGCGWRGVGVCAAVMCSSSREVTILNGEVLCEHVPLVVDTFADILMRPAFVRPAHRFASPRNALCSSECAVVWGGVGCDTYIHTYLQKEAELAEVREAYADVISDRQLNTESMIMDAIHAAAYKGNTLGNPLIAPKHNLQKVTPPPFPSAQLITLHSLCRAVPCCAALCCAVLWFD